MKRFFFTFIFIFLFALTTNAQIKRNLVIVQVDTIAEVSDTKYTRSKPIIFCIENDSYYRYSYTQSAYVLFEIATQGIKGDKGDKGDTGNAGANGVNGVNGTNGVDGINGTNGAQGLQGAKGDTGLTGAQGLQGIQGVAGTNGTNGTTPTDAQLLALFSANNYRKIYVAQQTQAVPLIALGGTYNFNVTVTNAALNMVCVVNTETALIDLLTAYDCRVSAANTVTVRLKAGVAVAAGNRVFDIRVIQ